MSEQTVLDRLRTEYLRAHPGRAAIAIESAAPDEAATLLGTVPSETAAGVLVRLSPEMASRTLAALGDAAFAAVASLLEPVRLASWVARLDDGDRERRLDLLDEGLAAALRELLAYPHETAGREMDPRVTSFRLETTAGEALARLRATHHDEFEDVYLVDDQGLLAGAVPLERLALADPSRPLSDLAGSRVAGVQATSPIDDVLDVFAQTRSGGVPVVDFHGRLLGVVRQADLVDAAEEAASANLQTMVGASRDERALSPVSFAVRKRLPWLTVNLVTAFVAAAVVGLFEGTIARISALAVLMPIVAGQSGNGGAQALAVTMRGLALREVRTGDWRRLAVKESAVALMNSVAISVITSSCVFLWSRSAGLAVVIGVSMVVSMTVAGLAGASVPIVLKRLGQDPAQSSSIVLTTVTDVVGFLSFLGLATLLAGAIGA